ncbi:MAG: hypothetical protein M3N47_09440 [Chloroflexota bacterium]|nr:hypothetical protein [Chloroflexota bacterium]
MAPKPKPPVGVVPHEAQLSVDQRAKEIIERGEREIVERRKAERRKEQPTDGQEANNAAFPEDRRERDRRIRDRAHRTVMGTTEPEGGAPRSGSA